MNPIVELCARKCEESVGSGDWPMYVNSGNAACAAAIRAIPESEIAAVAGEPLTCEQKQELIRYWSIRDVNECVNEIVRLSAAPAVPGGMRMVRQEVIDWLMGSGPNPSDGTWFERPLDAPQFWWRSELRKLLAACGEKKT